ncbi:trna pseudouridine synthase-like 1 [Stylonychia lemnae]|uniref:Trna pseudouridine synthase-like 1 n=1 Tax=Stylonychia lemnae TaxID=5949 RepID=A0A077ZPM4_STYLE|nr:trna pseudouridine synthase-like 1 [Stylonychia lemnae]|eukprot:CDW71414.1 trna pseudouridine synthase-like 1 [Stylonychia lemnae]
MNAFTFDAAENENRKEYPAESLRRGLNNHFAANGEQLQVNQLYQLKEPRFDCRGAPISRTYVYKILLTDNARHSRSKYSQLYRNLAWEVDRNSIDLEKFKLGCKLFEGYHCFKHFVRLKADEVNSTCHQLLARSP